MEHDHTYDCRLCGAHLDSQQDLNKHNRECHTAQAQYDKPESPRQASDSNDASRKASDLNDTPRNF
jgi:hypothetical protein